MSPRGVHELPIEKYEAAFLYILTNMPEMDEFFEYVDVQPRLLVYFISSLFTPLRKFDKEHWKSRTRARLDQLRELRLKGWKNSHGQHGPNFFDWFKEVMLLNAPNSHYLSVPFFTLLKLTHHYYCGHAVLEESYY
jgi:hypothetical protein